MLVWVERHTWHHFLGVSLSFSLILFPFVSSLISSPQSSWSSLFWPSSRHFVWGMRGERIRGSPPHAGRSRASCIILASMTHRTTFWKRVKERYERRKCAFSLSIYEERDVGEVFRPLSFFCWEKIWFWKSLFSYLWYIFMVILIIIVVVIILLPLLLSKHRDVMCIVYIGRESRFYVRTFVLFVINY